MRPVIDRALGGLRLAAIALLAVFAAIHLSACMFFRSLDDLSSELGAEAGADGGRKEDGSPAADASPMGSDAEVGLPQGAVARFSFEGDLKDAVTGSPIGSLQTGAGFVDGGVAGKALAVNGLGQGVWFGDRYGVATGISVAFWARPRSTQPAPYATLLHTGSDWTDSNNTDPGVGLGLISEGGRQDVSLVARPAGGSPVDLTRSCPALFDASRYRLYVVLLQPGAKMRLSVDTFEIGSVDLPAGSYDATNAFTVGSFYVNDAHGFAGEIDELFVYRRMLSDTDIVALWQSFGGQTALPPCP